jgi:hypothetical protein
MSQEESGLFQIRLNEEGKKYIRKFAALSYTMIVLVFFQTGIAVYWSVRMIIWAGGGLGNIEGYAPRFYDKIYPYVSIVFNIMGLIANIYYLKFPRAMLRSVNINDEHGANKAFGLLFRGALIFFFYLLLNALMMIWDLIIR